MNCPTCNHCGSSSDLVAVTSGHICKDPEACVARRERKLDQIKADIKVASAPATTTRFVQVKISACIEIPKGAKSMRADATDHLTDLIIQFCEERGWYFGGGIEAYDVDENGEVK